MTSTRVLTEYGHLLETFAVGEILKQVSWSDAPVAAGQLPTDLPCLLTLSGLP